MGNGNSTPPNDPALCHEFELWIRSLGKSNTELAKKTGITLSSVGRLIANKQKLTKDMAAKLCVYAVNQKVELPESIWKIGSYAFFRVYNGNRKNGSATATADAETMKRIVREVYKSKKVVPAVFLGKYRIPDKNVLWHIKHK